MQIKLTSRHERLSLAAIANPKIRQFSIGMDDDIHLRLKVNLLKGFMCFGFSNKFILATVHAAKFFCAFLSKINSPRLKKILFTEER